MSKDNHVPQDILDRLTRVPMPQAVPAKSTDETIDLDGMRLKVYRSEALVVGSGAAGLRSAVEMKRRNLNVMVISTSLFGGTSACSGSDKQTLHTAGTSNRGDDFMQLAKDISSGGAMDMDSAYIESVGSLGAMAGLQYLGLPLPQDRFGAVLRYQTDHDDVGRATSCGPRTSRLMVKVLAEEAVRLDIPFLRGTEAVRLLIKDSDGKASIQGVVAIDRQDKTNDLGLILILSPNIVLATGGPGELYRDSVYPKHCYGSLGMAIEAGVEVCNLTESQFGIGTRRTEFPWNLSGTYVQVLPYIYSTDENGQEYNFLADYYRSTQEMVSNVFRKGYQWPFHATRMLDYGSSLVDYAIYQESQKGRTVFMDFNRNPLPVDNDKAFSLDRLDADVRTYLQNNDALQDMPIDRLKQMNPLAIELYKMHGHDINETPLPFNVSNQHMNGGIAVDSWSQSNIVGCYAVGEVAGTHGVTRPGGAALNAGQVAGLRAAEHITHTDNNQTIDLGKGLLSQISESIGLATNALENSNGLKVDNLRNNIQNRMSDKAGFICHVDEVTEAFKEAKALRHDVWQQGIHIERPARIADIFHWRHLALTSEAVLQALTHFIEQGGGSRGARALIDPKGKDTPQAANGPLNEIRFRREREQDKTNKITLRFCPKDNTLNLREIPIRQIEDLSTIYFEKNWSNYLTGDIHNT